MTITFLGTGTSQGVPVIACSCPVCRSVDFRDNRTRTSVHIEDEDLSLVIDTGPDFRSQVLRERINKLDAVLYTHQHKDHTAGLDEVRSYNFAQKMDMPLYGSNEVLAQLKRDYEYIFAEHKYPGIPKVETREITDQPFKIKNTLITPINVLHYKLPVFGFRIKGFTYITDANYISEEEKDKIRDSDIFVINALRKEKHISHFNLEEALAIIEEIKPKKAYLTHISHLLGKHSDVEDELPENVEIAYDGLKINL